MRNRPGKRKKARKYLYLWHLKNPDPLFNFLATILAPGKIFFKLLSVSVVPGLVIVFMLFHRHLPEYYHDVGHLYGSLTFVIHHALNLVLANLTAKIAQAVAQVHYGVPVKKFGLILAANFFPRFYNEREPLFQLDRRQQLWCFGIPLISRLVMAVWGGVFWYITRDSGTMLPILLLALAQSSLFDLVFDGFPFWRGDGLFLMAAFFRLPLNFGYRSRQLWRMIFTSRPIPKELIGRKKAALLFFYPASIIGSLYLIGTIIFHFARGLDMTFPGIFGRASSIILIILLFAVVFQRQLKRFFRAKQKISAKEV